MQMQKISDRIIWEDSNLIVVHKPAGMLVQSDRSFDVDLVSALKSYLVKKGEKCELSVINRLDRPVSGLVLLAKNKQMAAKVTKELMNGQICKEYYAIVCGELEKAEGELVDYLLKDGKNNISRVVSKGVPGAKEARLSYKVLAAKNVTPVRTKTQDAGNAADDGNAMQEVVLSLVKVHLHTGRHHQIRVQFAHMGHPLLGDAKYNPLKIQVPVKNVSLCSAHLEFLGKSFTIKPDDAAFEYFREELEIL